MVIRGGQQQMNRLKHLIQVKNQCKKSVKCYIRKRKRAEKP